MNKTICSNQNNKKSNIKVNQATFYIVQKKNNAKTNQIIMKHLLIGCAVFCFKA